MIKNYRLSQMSKDFQEFMRAMYSQRGWICPEWVHVDLEKMEKDIKTKPNLYTFFREKGILQEKPKERIVH